MCLDPLLYSAQRRAGSVEVNAIKFCLFIFVTVVIGIVIGLNLAPVIAPREEQASEDYQRLQKSYWHTLGQLHKEMSDQIPWEPKENPPKEEDPPPLAYQKGNAGPPQVSRHPLLEGIETTGCLCR
jgi:hypothetical protein